MRSQNWERCALPLTADPTHRDSTTNARSCWGRVPRALVMLLSMASGLFVGACERSDKGGATVDMISSAELTNLAPEEIARRAAELSQRASQHSVREPEGVALRRAAARLWKAKWLRGDSAGAGIERARMLLEQASRVSSTPGACEAAVELAELLAREAEDLSGARRVARGALERFHAKSHAACLARARRLDRGLSALALEPGFRDSFADSKGGWRSGAHQLNRVQMFGADRTSSRSVRTILSFDRPTRFRKLPLERGGRAYRVPLEVSGLTLSPGIKRRYVVDTGGLRLVTIADGQGAGQIHFELPLEAQYRIFHLPDPFRLIVDTQLSSDTPRARDASGPVIVLDPGHGGDDFGTRYAGLKESELALDLSRRVAQELQARAPTARVLLTRQSDVMVDLERRALMANSAGADVFVSIHLNGVPEPVRRGGVTTFYLDGNNDRQALRLVARENGTSTRTVSGLQRILADLHREGQITASRKLAASIHRSVLKSGRRILPHLPDRGVKQAMFYVLVGATMPAVLVEASFMTHPKEAEALRSTAYRQALARGIANGVLDYTRP